LGWFKLRLALFWLIYFSHLNTFFLQNRKVNKTPKQMILGNIFVSNFLKNNIFIDYQQCVCVCVWDMFLALFISSVVTYYHIFNSCTEFSFVASRQINPYDGVICSSYFGKVNIIQQFQLFIRRLFARKIWSSLKVIWICNL